jgi:hypothetical protein
VDVVNDQSTVNDEQGATAQPFITPRRLARWATVVGIGIVLVLAAWQDPLYAEAV